MKEFRNINDILDFAMKEEQKAVDFYTSLAANARTADMKSIFEQFAREEVGHKARLKEIRSGGLFDLPSEKVSDLKISDYLVNVEPSPDMGYQDALILAMKKEKAAFKLYIALADRSVSADIKEVFLTLAQEESRHKLRFEIEYDEYVLREN